MSYFQVRLSELRDQKNAVLDAWDKARCEGHCEACEPDHDEAMRQIALINAKMDEMRKACVHFTATGIAESLLFGDRFDHMSTSDGKDHWYTDLDFEQCLTICRHRWGYKNGRKFSVSIVRFDDDGGQLSTKVYAHSDDVTEGQIKGLLRDIFTDCRPIMNSWNDHIR